MPASLSSDRLTFEPDRGGPLFVLFPSTRAQAACLKDRPEHWPAPGVMEPLPRGDRQVYPLGRISTEPGTLWLVELQNLAPPHTTDESWRTTHARLVRRIREWTPAALRLLAVDCAQRLVDHLPETDRDLLEDALLAARCYAGGAGTYAEMLAARERYVVRHPERPDAAVDAVLCCADRHLKTSRVMYFGRRVLGEGEYDWQVEHMARLLRITDEDCAMNVLPDPRYPWLHRDRRP